MPWGTTQAGGASGYGTVFALYPPASSGASWTETLDYSFTGQNGDGANPIAGVVLGEGGVLYGTTQNGGAHGMGTVFQVSPPTVPGGAWSESILYSFTGQNGDGAAPYAGVTIGSGGVLYGTTYGGGSASNPGTVFQLTSPASPDGTWTEKVIKTFSSSNHGLPTAGVTLGPGGVLYGSTNLVFELTPPANPRGAWKEAFAVPIAGGSTESLILAGDGTLYGAN